MFITISTIINKPVEVVWKKWTSAEDIIHWYFASDDWQCPLAENDLKPDGKFNLRMEAKDGSIGFDFEGTYSKIITNELIEYEIIDGRKVKTEFIGKENRTEIIGTFEPDNDYTHDQQQSGWQAILDNFRKYAEGV